MKLSNGITVPTDDTALDSALVLIGRGFTDWLIHDNASARQMFFAVPHSVKTLADSRLENRTVYARMRVPPPTAVTTRAGNLNFANSPITFEEFFMSQKNVRQRRARDQPIIENEENVIV